MKPFCYSSPAFRGTGVETVAPTLHDAVLRLHDLKLLGVYDIIAHFADGTNKVVALDDYTITNTPARELAYLGENFERTMRVTLANSFAPKTIDAVIDALKIDQNLYKASQVEMQNRYGYKPRWKSYLDIIENCLENRK